MKKHLDKAICLIIILSRAICASGQVPGYVPEDSLVLWWTCNENVNDASGNGHNGIVGGPVPTQDRFNIPNSAFDFALGDSLRLANTNPMEISQSPGFTISFWFLNNSTEDFYLFEMFSAGAFYFDPDWSYLSMQKFNDQLGVDWSGGLFGESYFNISTGINPSQFWNHVAFSVNMESLTAKFYYNGIEINETIVSSFFLSELTAIKFGAYNWSGKIDDFGVWNRALNNEEIQDLYNSSGIQIKLFSDINQTCTPELNESGVPGITLELQPIGQYFQSPPSGAIFIDSLPNGVYTLTANPNADWSVNCTESQTFEIVDGIASNVVCIPLVSNNPCPLPDISITCPTMRRCSEHAWPIYVSACNQYGATEVLNGAYILVHLDENIIVDQLATPYYTMENGLYRFELGNINPGQCIDVIINANFSCDLELNETLCMEATLYPVPDCQQDTVPVPGPCELPWDQSSLSVNGWCDESAGIVSFTVTNSGDDMDCFSEVRVYLDGELIETYYIQLVANSDTTFTFPSSEGTWILQADQHPLHPGNSHPNDHVEGCGDVEGEGDGEDDDGDGDTEDDDEWTPGLVDDLPSGDESPFVDEFCGQVVGSFDPNDKRGFPDGIGEAHEILPNEQLQYLIRFQNTGTAPAYTVVIRDTLDTDLDIFSVISGTSSHDYSFTMYGERVLQWTFNNIMLPDSFSNEEGSHGFITYTVNQVTDLSDGTTITNSAAIYFDSNEPVITNTTLHTINHCLFSENQSTLDATTCGVYTAPDGQQYDQSGTYTAVLTNAAGCDSTITIHLNAIAINPTITGDGSGLLAAGPEGYSYQWFDCATNQPVTENGTGITFEGTDGTYYVQVSNGVCTETTDCMSLVGVGELGAASIHVFPIPASNLITAVWYGDATAYAITALDARIVCSGRIASGANIIDIGSLASGSYFLKADNRVTRFVVK